VELKDLKLQALGLANSGLGRILTIVDFGNVNYWYKKDRIGPDAAPLFPNQYLIVDLERLFNFIKDFSYQARFYYGWHSRLSRSQHIVIKAEKLGFIKNTKRIQYVKHYLSADEIVDGHKQILNNETGRYIEIPKCNFDVEITLDSIRLMDEYDTLCLFSGDSDFARLAHYIKKKGKKFVVVASGQIYHELKTTSDVYINAQQVKSYIVSVKETSPLAGRSLNIGSASGGQGGVTLRT